MKKLFLTAFMAVMAITASAQEEQSFRMGMRINGGLSKITGSTLSEALGLSGDTDKTSASFGYGFGWVAEYNLNSNLFVQSGVGLENIAHKEDAISGGSLDAFYLQVPVHVGYRHAIGDNLSIFALVGPTVSYGIFGSKIDVTAGSNTESFNYFDVAKRFDLGIGGRIGVEIGKIQVSAGANYGLLKVVDDGGHNLCINLVASHMF